MQSQREIQRKYEKLMLDVKTKDFYKIDLTNRVNVYSCACGIRIKTKDVDAGVTPMFKMCDCGQMAKSSFYKDIAPELEPSAEWYRPSLSECLKFRKNVHGDAILEHIFNGGLEYRKTL